MNLTIGDYFQNLIPYHFHIICWYSMTVTEGVLIIFIITSVHSIYRSSGSFLLYYEYNLHPYKTEFSWQSKCNKQGKQQYWSWATLLQTLHRSWRNHVHTVDERLTTEKSKEFGTDKLILLSSKLELLACWIATSYTHGKNLTEIDFVVAFAIFPRVWLKYNRSC